MATDASSHYRQQEKPKSEKSSRTAALRNGLADQTAVLHTNQQATATADTRHNNGTMKITLYLTIKHETEATLIGLQFIPHHQIIRHTMSKSEVPTSLGLPLIFFSSVVLNQYSIHLCHSRSYCHRHYASHRMRSRHSWSERHRPEEEQHSYAFRVHTVEVGRFSLPARVSREITGEADL